MKNFNENKLALLSASKTLKLTLYASVHEYIKSVPLYAEAETLEEAQAMVQDFISEFGLGSSTYDTCNVYAEDGEYLGNISYNGRFWPKNSKYGEEYRP